MKGGQTVSLGSCRGAAGWGGVPLAVCGHGGVWTLPEMSSLNLQQLAELSGLYYRCDGNALKGRWGARI